MTHDNTGKLVTDPICGMKIDPTTAVDTVDWNGSWMARSLQAI